MTDPVSMTAGLGAHPLGALTQVLSAHFMVNALRAGTIVAVVAGAVGWFTVLRHQVFAAHSLAMVSFPGAAAALLAGVSLSVGYFGACVAAALALGALRREPTPGGRSVEAAVTGTVQAFALACGVLCTSLYRGFATSVTDLLFGTFLGISDRQVLTLLVVGTVVVALLAAIGRPLVFASVDPEVAAARGVPVRALSVTFLVLLGAATAEVSQITGALLVFALVVIPASTAARLTARPGLGVALSAGIGVAVTWVGLTAAYFSDAPVGFWVVTVGFAAYLSAVLCTAVHPLRGVLRAAVARRRVGLAR